MKNIKFCIEVVYVYVIATKSDMAVAYITPERLEILKWYEVRSFSRASNNSGCMRF